MKKYVLLIFFSFALSSSLISCRETKSALEETEEAVDEGIEEVEENTGLEEGDGK